MKSLIVIIYNPAARKSSSEKIRLASDLLQRKGFSTELLTTRKAGDAEIFARDYREKKPLLILAAGGDGTINEVINGIALSDVPLAILPLGTTNVLAREINISHKIPISVEAALAGKPKAVSLGKIETATASRYFCLMAGIGFDGRSVHDMKASIKEISGEAAYFLSGINNLVSYSPDNILIRMNGNEYPAHSAIIGKASRYGGDFMVTPDASLFEPYLYACIFKGRKRTDLLKYVFGVFRGTHLKYSDVVYEKADSIEISGKAHVQIDGDYFGVSPAKITVEKDALNLIC